METTITFESEVFKKIMERINGLDRRFDLMIRKAKNPLKEQWLDNQDVLFLLKCSVRTLQRHRDKLRLPFTKINGKIYYRVSDVNHLLDTFYDGRRGRI